MVKIKTIILRFLGLGNHKNCQANVFIYDYNYNLVAEGSTVNAKFKTCLKENYGYILKAQLNNQTITSSFYVYNNCANYNFAFDYSIFNPKSNAEEDTITLLLTDYYYPNLLIEKGEIILNG